MLFFTCFLDHLPTMISATGISTGLLRLPLGDAAAKWLMDSAMREFTI
jgi:hypothetical protein